MNCSSKSSVRSPLMIWRSFPTSLVSSTVSFQFPFLLWVKASGDLVGQKLWRSWQATVGQKGYVLVWQRMGVAVWVPNPFRCTPRLFKMLLEQQIASLCLWRFFQSFWPCFTRRSLFVTRTAFLSLYQCMCVTISFCAPQSSGATRVASSSSYRFYFILIKFYAAFPTYLWHCLRDMMRWEMFPSCQLMDRGLQRSPCSCVLRVCIPSPLDLCTGQVKVLVGHSSKGPDGRWLDNAKQCEPVRKESHACLYWYWL